MFIETTRFGKIEIDENLIFNFIKPILGYDHLKKFILLDHTTESPFKWLQSIDDSTVAFPVTFPELFNIEYEYVIPKEDADILEITSVDQLLSFNIARIPAGNPALSTINLLAPIIVNAETKNAIQLVLTDTNYSVKEKLFDETKTSAIPTAEEKGE